MKWSRLILDWLPPLVWAGIIFWLSHMSAPPVPSGFAINDKVAHALVYSVLAWLFFRGFCRFALPHWAAILSFVCSAIYGATDEFHQRFVPGRLPSIYDWYADMVGAGLVCGLAWLVCVAWRRRKKERIPDVVTLPFKPR